MHKLYILAVLVISCISCVVISQFAGATDKSEIVFSQIYAGSLSDSDYPATQEFISIYNNGDKEININNWCVANKSDLKFACFIPKSVNEIIYLPSHAYATIGSDSFLYDQNSLRIDVTFITPNKQSGALVASGDSLKLIDSTGLIVDDISWSSFPSGSVLQRQTDPLFDQRFIDTNYASDFQRIDTLLIPKSGLDERIIFDVCSNVDGFQDDIPAGLFADGMGNCVKDVCLNITGLQQIPPDDMEFDANLNCVLRDKCINLDGAQAMIPDGYAADNSGNCKLDLLPLKISEILPNAVGLDSGNEFIEIYNPNDTKVELTKYVLGVGIDNVVAYNFPENLHIEPKQYMAFYNNDIKFALVNTTSAVSLSSVDGELIDKVPAYFNPQSGLSWALINNVWQYTNHVTPGFVNSLSFTEPAVVQTITDSSVENVIKPCAANQYRNPDTNRCKNISMPSSDSVVTPCREGQYRSEETNRCRNIVSNIAVLTPCDSGEERNPETNRCKSVAAVLGASDLKPCDSGQERNPETNRCRNVTSNMPAAAYAPKQAKQSDNNYILWISVAGVGLVAIIYGVWEWRQEIIRLISKVGLFHRRDK